jgi:N-carbamoyl-L-amino-acid hydrolase
MSTKSIINIDRLMARMFEMAKIGATDKGGVNRLTLTDLDKQARYLFSTWCEDLGMEVRFDEMGNQFAHKVGSNPDLPPVLIGSHLDSQPTGGKYDGVLGVLGGLEVVERIIEEKIPHRHSIEVVNWTNEEGTRFSPAIMGSGVFAGAFDLDFAYQSIDSNGLIMGKELKRIGFKGAKQPPVNYKAFLEIHIEQGPVLEDADIPIGLVAGVNGIRWYKAVITGEESHAGPSPMNMRRDPVMILHSILSEIYEIGEVVGADARITIGSIATKPGSINTVPGEVEFTIDIRHPNKQVLQKMDRLLQQIFRKPRTPIEVKSELIETWQSDPVQFHKKCTDAIRDAANKLGIPYMEIVSGAGHDAIYLSRVTPTGMIFIPCKDGVSHNESEYAKPEDIEAGVSVLYETVRSLIDVEETQS